MDRIVLFVFISKGECPTPVSKFSNGMVGFYINCATESDIFGKGMAVGAYIFHPSEDGTEWVLNGHPSMIFDDQVVPRGLPRTKHTHIFDPEWPHIENNVWRFSFIADGVYNTHLSGENAFVYSSFHHYTHEAGLEYLALRTSYDTPEKMFSLRKRFLTRLATQFGVVGLGPLDPDAYDDIPPPKIMAYVVNEQSKQRILNKRGFNGGDTLSMPSGSRLHEGGFRFVVGHAGIKTNDGRIPFGSIFQEGVFYLEDSTIPHGGWEIDFFSQGPAILNGWATSVAYHALYHPELGHGRLYGLYPLPEPRDEGLALAARGAMVFGNLDTDSHPPEEFNII